MTDVKWRTQQIKDLNFNINKAEENLTLWKEKLSHHRRELRKLLDAGETTGDHIYDLAARIGREDETELQERLRIVQALLTGKVGELVLLTYAQSEIYMSRRGGPGPGESWDKYDDVWYIACGILTDEKLQIEKNAIILPIDQYVVSPYDGLGRKDLAFTLQKNPFTGRRKILRDDEGLVYRLEAYATPEADHYDLLRLIVGDAEVQEFLNTLERKRMCKNASGHFRECCNLLRKLVLESPSMT